LDDLVGEVGSGMEVLREGLPVERDVLAGHVVGHLEAAHVGAGGLGGYRRGGALHLEGRRRPERVRRVLRLDEHADVVQVVGVLEPRQVVEAHVIVRLVEKAERAVGHALERRDERVALVGQLARALVRVRDLVHQVRVRARPRVHRERDGPLEQEAARRGVQRLQVGWRCRKN